MNVINIGEFIVDLDSPTKESHNNTELLRRLIAGQHGERHLLREVLEEVKQHKPKVRRWLVIIQPLEPITKKEKSMDALKLPQIPLGMRCPVDFVPDEAVDVKSDGNFGAVAIVSGDATAQVAPGSTPTKFRVYFNGDGAVGKKSATVSVDGHVGDGDVEITQEVDWEVISKDATTFGATVGALEPIPAPPVA